MPSHKSAAAAVPVLVVWLGLALLGVGAALPTQPSSSCQRECGGVDIPYPFGIVDSPGDSTSDCAMPGFGLTCNETDVNGGRRRPFYYDVEVVSVSLQQGQARMKMSISTYCYNTTTRDMDAVPWELNFKGTPYRFADTNKFTVIGCQTLAYIEGEHGDDADDQYMSGCVAMCRRGGDSGDVRSALSNGSCSGIGCCQTAIPRGLQYYRVLFDSGFNTKEIHNVSRCSYAVLMDDSDFTFSTTYATTPGFNTSFAGEMPLAVDWAVGNETCDAARKDPSSYACVSDNSECFDSLNGPGYFCNCSKGYQGNPYLQDPEQGCKDINECADLAKYPCSVPGTCKNLPGGFKCSCPKHTKGDAQNGTCERNHTLGLGEKFGIGAFGVVLIVLVCILAIEIIRHKRSIKRQALIRQSDEYYQQHGGEILSEIMRVERNIGFTVYARAAIEAGTNMFDKENIIGEGGQGTVYKAVLDVDGKDTLVAVKRCNEVDESRRKDFVQELVILCRVDHPNIVKLLGCCLQFEVPILVYEYVKNKTLQELLYSQPTSCRATLGTRLRIAAQSAGALAYLHSLAHPILHGDVKPANILLSDGWVAKVSDFGCSTIDEKTQVVARGTAGYVDPEYLLEYQLTHKNDVYSFGVLLLELLTGKKPLSKQRKSLMVMVQESMGDGTLHHLFDREIVDDASMGVAVQAAELATRCLVMPGNRRPVMRRVAEELKQLADQVQQPLVLECHNLTVTDMESSMSSESDTTGVFSLEKKAALSIEFAR
ncbi:wall-associated receptor kinase 2 [Aegilops tauschii subsp. strangulata]|uniref:Protein kinase domain-containing protein n=1 Tax=Aegilops tauschii subsp. strangulata TaxID=200361 RepID=A0A453DNT8_AEGTS|nr:wall-associated receptor kinase 2 [Aegilops tauschii subsp. strangulata]